MIIVTVNTDASFSRVHEIGTFAFWIVCNEFKILKSGILRKKVFRPEMAEFKCIINALHILFNEDLSMVNKVIINTDCLNVIHIMTNNKMAISQYRLNNWGNGMMVIVMDMCKKKGFDFKKIEMRHVKSHTGIGDARSYVNEWCDKEAKRMLRIKLTEIAA